MHSEKQTNMGTKEPGHGEAHFISSVHEVSIEVEAALNLVDEFKGQLEPYSKAPELGETAEGKPEPSYATDLDEEIAHLENKVQLLQNKIGTLMQRFNG